MSFSQKDYFFSHTMTRFSQARQPATFRIDLNGLIPVGDCSTLFVINNMSVTAYKQGTLEKIPVKFTVLDENKKRVLTNDLCKLSSKWLVEINGGSSMKIAGTETEPFNRTLSVYDEENRQALVNVLAFMMSNSLWTSDRARGAFEVLVNATQGQFDFTCELCSECGVARIMKGANGQPSFSFPECTDNSVCIPCEEPSADQEYEALRNLLALLRSSFCDNLDILNRVTQEMAMNNRSFQELDCTCFPPRHVYTGNIIIPYALMKYITSLYQTMSEYADNFAIVDEKMPHVKVLIESPSENLGEITGRMSLTIIYGPSVSAIYSKLSHGLCQQRHADNCEEQQQLDGSLLANITQLGKDVLIRRTPLSFGLNNHMSLKDWYNFYYG